MCWGTNPSGVTGMRAQLEGDPGLGLETGTGDTSGLGRRYFVGEYHQPGVVGQSAGELLGEGEVDLGGRQSSGFRSKEDRGTAYWAGSMGRDISGGGLRVKYLAVAVRSIT